MLRWLYDVGFLMFAIFSLPHFLVRLRQAEDGKRLIRERFGFYSSDTAPVDSHRPIWIHCVSVGEALAAERLIQILLERKPEHPLVVTTVTPTGQRMVKKWEGSRLKVLYFPFDIHFAVRRFFDRIQPSALLLVETEIWPNVISEAVRRKIPVGIVNGRLSERSFRSFRRFKPLFGPLLGRIDFFLVQTEADRNRLLALGVDPEKVTVTGNMKLDAFKINGQWKNDRENLRQHWGFLASELILIGGSTHEGEEEILLRVLRRLRTEKFPVRLVLAPRHVERSEKIFAEVLEYGFKPVLASSPAADRLFDVLILDQLGELRRLYAAADAVFMGGSLIRHGGQNPVEPAVYRRPIVHGPWVFNFEEIYRRLDEEGGSTQVKSEDELAFVLKRILGSDREREQLGTQAHEILRRLQGATERNFNLIEGKL